MDKNVDSKSQTVNLEIAGTDVVFNVSRKDYNDYINGMAGKKKLVQGANNFLMATVDPESRSFLIDIISRTPGGEMDIVGVLIESYAPDLEVIVKKPKTSQA